eukprot:TRINITY_DN18151_c0_g1_i1.p1 TRINITY_DN18151_c0_g1~~TRINITY_DN18151_c0_g1_i1.p1  ORF type:complete len:272 (+),score=68.29 TRINITY_DN18151_c0_g1_i1:94-816(+)
MTECGDDMQGVLAEMQRTVSIVGRDGSIRNVEAAPVDPPPPEAQEDGCGSDTSDIAEVKARLSRLEAVVTGLARAAEEDRALITSLVKEVKDVVRGLCERDGLRQESFQSERMLSHCKSRASLSRASLHQTETVVEEDVWVDAAAGLPRRVSSAYQLPFPQHLHSGSSTASINPPSVALDHTPGDDARGRAPPCFDGVAEARSDDAPSTTPPPHRPAPHRTSVFHEGQVAFLGTMPSASV